MPSNLAKNKIMTVRAHSGDAKTLLAFDIPDRKNTTNLAGFTIRCEPQGQPPFFLFNNLRFEVPANHAQIDTEPAASTVNAPIHKFRWLHIPGSVHQGVKPFRGPYTYTVTPRFFDDNGSMLPIDASLGVPIQIDVVPFRKGNVELGFTRGFTQSQAFDRHFGLNATIEPKKGNLLFDTGKVAGTNDSGQQFTFLDEYDWLGFTAREKIFALLEEVQANKSLRIDLFAYDLNEPDLIRRLLGLGAEGRARIILDDASLHHNKNRSTSEDQFEKQFAKAAGKEAIKRGHFGRFAHNKVIVVSDKNAKSATQAVKVLTGSTNFSVTGLYVNSNHILVFDDADVAAKYAEVFQAAWDGDVKPPSISKSPLGAGPFPFSSKGLPATDIAFSPHPGTVAQSVLDGMADRIQAEGKTKGGSVLFAVMEVATGTGPVLEALRNIHANQDIYSYGISDSTSGIQLYSIRRKTGVLVTGKPRQSQLPPPFDQVRVIGGFAHQVHHKFVVCGFNGPNPVVYCGSSNLALAGEQVNGDNLIAIHDSDVATAFAIEALGLVDHFDFLDRAAAGAKGAAKKPKFASKEQVAASAGMFLSTTDKWVEPYYDTDDLHCADRLLFR
jgi:hypothetical protein